MCVYTHVYKIVVRIYIYHIFIDIDLYIYMYFFDTYIFVHVSGVVETCTNQTKCIGKYATNGCTWHRFVKSLAKFTATKKLVL